MFSCDFSNLPCVTMTGKAREKRGWSHSGRTMETNLLVIFHGGDCTFEIDGKQFAYGKGDIALVPKHTSYKPYTERLAEYTFFHFDAELSPCSPNDLPSMPGDAGLSMTVPFYGFVSKGDTRLFFDYRMNVGSKEQEIELLLNKCLNTQFYSDNQRQLLLSIYFSEMMFYISQVFRDEQFRSGCKLPATLSKILLFIQEHYTHPITLDEICRHTKVSPQYCMRLFRQYMHMTIHEYICDLRMRYASYLLRHTYMNVSQTAEYLGFSSVGYFSRVFKHYYGVPPSEYYE